MRNKPSILLMVAILTLMGRICAPQDRNDGRPSKGSRAVNRNAYHGPTSLGPLSITRGKGEIKAESLWSLLGLAGPARTGLICYHDRDSGTYLIVELAADNRQMVRGLTLSRLNVCPGKKVLPAKGFSSWTTDEGVHLGSPEGDVFLKYGKPSSIDEMRNDPGFYPYPMREKGSDQLRRGRILNYRAIVGTPDTSHAFFGVRDGLVVWMTISDNE